MNKVAEAIKGLLVLTPFLQGGRVTHFVAGGSTGGTISGTGKFLKEKNPEIEVTLADPKGSIFGKKFRGEVGRLHHCMVLLCSCR